MRFYTMCTVCFESTILNLGKNNQPYNNNNFDKRKTKIK